MAIPDSAPARAERATTPAILWIAGVLAVGASVAWLSMAGAPQGVATGDGLVVAAGPAPHRAAPIPGADGASESAGQQIAVMSRDDDAPAERNLDINDHANLAGYLASQPRDALWSGVTEDALRSRYAALPHIADPGNHFAVRCGTTLCEVSATLVRIDEDETNRTVDSLTEANAVLGGPGGAFVGVSTTAVSDDPRGPGKVQIVAFLHRAP